MRTIRRAPYVRPVALLVTLALWTGFAVVPAAAQPSSPQATPIGDPELAPSLAVVQVVNQSGSSIQNLGSRAAASLNERFMSAKRFRVLGQDAVDRAVADVGARLPLKPDPRDGVLLRIAQSLRADYLVLTTIDSVEADVSQKMAVVRSSTKVFGRGAEAIVCEVEITALNLERANNEALLIDDALEQNAIQTAKDVGTQLHLRGRVLTSTDFNIVRVNIDQRDYLRPGTLLTVLRKGLKIATLKVNRVTQSEAYCEIVEREKPDLSPAVNDEVIVFREATMVPGTGRAAFDPGAGKPAPMPKRGESNVLPTVLGVLVGAAAIAAGFFLLSNGKDSRDNARTPRLVTPNNNASFSADGTGKLLTPMSFTTTSTISTDQYTIQIATDNQFHNLAFQKSQAGTLTSGTTDTGSTTGSRPPDPRSIFSFTPDTTATFLTGGTYFWRVLAASGTKTYISNVYTFSVNQSGGSGGIGGTGTGPRSPDTVTALSSNASIEIQWTPVAGAVYYHVFRRLLTPRMANGVIPGRTFQPTTGAGAWTRDTGRRAPRMNRPSSGLFTGTSRQTGASLAGFSEIAKVGPTVLSYTDTTVQNGTEYQYVVLTEDSNGNITPLVSAQSTSFVRATPLSNRPPAIPANFTAAPGNGQVTLTWSANAETDLAGYQVFRSTSANGNFVDVTSSLVTDDGSPAGQSLSAGPGDVSVTDRNATNGVAVFYRIRAVQMSVIVNGTTRGGLTSALSASVTATPSTSPAQELQVLQPVSGSTIDADRPELSWRGVSGATQYTIQISTDPTFATGVISTSATTTDVIYPATLPALTQGATYYIRVGVFDTTQQALRFGQVSNFKRGPVSRFTTTVKALKGGVALNGANLNIDGVDQSTLTPAQVILAPKTGNAAYVIKATFNDATGVRYQGTANYKPGVDPSTVTITLISVGTAPAMPKGLSATGEVDRIVLRWDPDPSIGVAGTTVASTYSIQRRANTAEGQFSEIAVVTAPTTTLPSSAPKLIYADVNVTTGTRYFYRLVALSAAGVESLPSSAADAVPGVGTIQVVAPQDNQTFGIKIGAGGSTWTSTINFGWIKVPSAARYVFELGTDPDLHNLIAGGNQLVAQSDLPSVSVTLGADAPSNFSFFATGNTSTMYFRVIAVDDQNRILNQTEARRIFITTAGLVANGP